jgi:outer membrane lipoprotein-sorting protein
MTSLERYVTVVTVALLITLSSFRSQEKYPGYRAINEPVQFKQHFSESATTIQSFKADFIQEKSMIALTEKISSKGKLWFKRDKKVRMDYTAPFTYKMVINGDKMSVKDAEKETHLNASSNKLLQQVNRIMVDCMQGTILDSKDFSSRIFENDHNYLIELTTTSKNLKSFLSQIVLVVEKKDNLPHSIELNEPSGDKTTIVLKNKIINSQLQDEVFSL